MFRRKTVFSSIGRAAIMATVAAAALTAVEPSLAFAGTAHQARASQRRPQPAPLPTSAPAAGTIGAGEVLRPPRLSASSAPVLRSQRHRTAAPIMTIPMVTMAGDPSITGRAQITTVVIPIIAADMVTGRSLIMAVTRTPPGNQAIRTDRSAGRLCGRRISSW